MKMRSSLVAAAVAACAAMLSAPASAARTAAEVFAGCEEQVLASSNCVFEADGRLFLVGRAASDERLGASAGFGKSRMLAFGRLDDWLRDSADWPGEATREERRLAWALLGDGRTSEAVLNGTETVCERHMGEGRWLVVLAVPESGISAAPRPGRSALAAAVESIRAAAKAPPEAPSAAGTAGDGLRPIPAPSPVEPAGYSETGGVIVNETMADGQY